MSVAMLRRRKLGRTSCREIAGFSNNIHHVVRNDKPMPDGVTLVIRWGTTSNIPVNNVVNTAEAIHRVGDKAGFRRLLMEQDGVFKIVTNSFVHTRFLRMRVMGLDSKMGLTILLLYAPVFMHKVSMSICATIKQNLTPLFVVVALVGMPLSIYPR